VGFPAVGADRVTDCSIVAAGILRAATEVGTWRAALGETALSVTLDSVLVQESEPKAADLDGRVVVLSVRAGSYFGFNRVAGEIWNMLAEPCRVGRIFDTLTERHDVDPDIMARDVTPFLQTLVEQRLARVVDPAEGR
jgi:hypothetical protein